MSRETFSGRDDRSSTFQSLVVDRLEGIVARPHGIRNEEYGYESHVRTYGYDLHYTEDGALVFDPGGLKNRFDRWGDTQVRRFDDHLVSEPGKLWRRHHVLYKKHSFFKAPPKRSRGTPEQVARNAQRLGMGDLYQLHPKGVEIKRPEVFTRGINLSDIFTVDHPALSDIDRNQALYEVGKYVSNIHAAHGAIGEINPIHFYFQEKEGNEVYSPQLGVPDIIFNSFLYPIDDPEKFKSLTEPKAVELLDFLWAAAAREIKKSNDQQSVEEIVGAFLNGYEDHNVISAIRSLAKRGRITVNDNSLIAQGKGEEPKRLPHTITSRLRGIASGHNMVHLSVKGFPPTTLQMMRSIIIDHCTEILGANS